MLGKEYEVGVFENPCDMGSETIPAPDINYCHVSSWRCGTCGQEFTSAGCGCNYPTQQQPDLPLQGWACPVCGAGNAPWKGRCDCVPTFTITTNFEEPDDG